MTSKRENIDRRVLGALRLLDEATGAVIEHPMRLTGQGMGIVRNLSKLYVIFEAPGLAHHTRSFAKPPDDPDPGSIRDATLIIEDPWGHYLPRTTTIPLPRDPASLLQSDSLFEPIEIVMHSTPAGKLKKNWSAVRVSLHKKSGEKIQPVAGAMVRVIKRSDSSLLARGITDLRGEGLIIVPGIPFTSFSETNNPNKPIITRETDVQLELIVDPQEIWPPDPDELEKNKDGWQANTTQQIDLQLRAGETVILPPIEVIRD